MNNKYGLDASYFKKKLQGVLDDVENYTPEEMCRELTKYADVASSQSSVAKEPSISAVKIGEVLTLIQSAEADLVKVYEKGVPAIFSFTNIYKLQTAIKALKDGLK